MGLIKAFSGAIGGTFADQWKDIISADTFDEQTAVVPGVYIQSNRGRGSNNAGSYGVITNGSKIFVPENCAAFIFSQSGIEEIIQEPGGYEYNNGEQSVFNNDGFGQLFHQMKERVKFGGQSEQDKQIAFVNLREIRGIKFGTRGPLVYHDLFYGTDLEVLSFGSFSIRIINPTVFIQNFVPANTRYYSFDDVDTRAQIVSEFLTSFTDAINTLSTSYRISQLPSQALEISKQVAEDEAGAGTWRERYGFEVVKVGIESIEFSPESRALVHQFSSNKMSLNAYEDVSQRASNISAQQKIAQGIQNEGLGDMGGMVFATNMAQSISPSGEMKQPQNQEMSFDEQMSALKKLKELLDANILTQEEFDRKKKEIMNL